MKKHVSTILLVVVFLIGLSLLLYPSFSNYWNSLHQSHAIADYREAVGDLDAKKEAELFLEAQTYNESLAEGKQKFSLSETNRKRYEALLDVAGTGMMGYIEIPSIRVSMPIYHGIDDGVLQIAAGHLEWSSLPVGGLSSHCVLSGHRGLPNAMLFTHLDKLQEGDYFQLHILQQLLTYEVDQIKIVEPDDLTDLVIEDGKDLCTLVTCTPYGINSHRLLVRGHRFDGDPFGSGFVSADALQIDPFVVAPILAAPVLLILFLILARPKQKKKR